jgi:hypothetical protein
MGFEVIIGLGLCLAAAFLLAFSMNIQQYALTCPDSSKFLKYISRNALWVLGLIVYLIAQLNFVAAVGMGPFAVMSALFTSVLIFDHVSCCCCQHYRNYQSGFPFYVQGIAYLAFKKVPSRHECAGLFIILIAVGLLSVFSPLVEYEVTPDAIGRWAIAWSGILTLLWMFGMLAVFITMVLRFERDFPNFPVRERRASDSDNIEPEPSPLELEVMRVVYPAVLASFETLGAASLKAVSGMLAMISKGEGKAVVSHPVFYLVLLMWLFCIVNTIVWLRKVYGKFKTTECLPTEIGEPW